MTLKPHKMLRSDLREPWKTPTIGGRQESTGEQRDRKRMMPKGGIRFQTYLVVERQAEIHERR
jgi:hypothetical protein